MRIGIDCRPLIKEKTGIGYYLWEILQAWAELHTEHEFWLYAPRDFAIPPAFASSGLVIQKRIVRVRPSDVWMHTVLPWQLAADRIDLYWGPNYAMPLWPMPIPAVLTIHDTVYKYFPETMRAITLWHNRLGLETYVTRCAGVLCPSQHTKQDIIEHLHVAADQICVTPLGVSDRIGSGAQQGAGASLPGEELSELSKQAGFDLQQKGFFLTVGTLEPRKNLSRVIEAFKQASQQLPDAHLVVVGTLGWGKAARELSDTLSDRIHYLGYVTDGELSALYQQATAFVYAPLYEGFGLPPLEAMKAATAVLVSRSSSLPEVVGECGLYTNPYDVQEMADKLVRLWTDDELRQSLGVKGQERALQMTWRKTAAQTLHYLESIGRS